MNVLHTCSTANESVLFYFFLCLNSLATSQVFCLSYFGCVCVYTVEYVIQSIWFRFYHYLYSLTLSHILYCLFFCLYVTICFSPSTIHLKIRFEAYQGSELMFNRSNNANRNYMCGVCDHFLCIWFFSIEFCTQTRSQISTPYFSYSNVYYSSTVYFDLSEILEAESSQEFFLFMYGHIVRHATTNPTIVPMPISF